MNEQSENPVRDAIAARSADTEVILFIKGTPTAPAGALPPPPVPALPPPDQTSAAPARKQRGEV